jgi:hypothetical protein
MATKWADIKVVIKTPKPPKADPAKTEADLDAKKAVNQRIAQRLLSPLSADQFRLTVEAFPDLAAAFDGTFSGDIPWKDVQVVNPERTERSTHPLYDRASERAAIRSKAVREANDPARAVNRAVANSERGKA